MHRFIALLAVVVALLLSSEAEAKGVKYAGVHPRTGKPDGGLCYLETVHVHALPPGSEALYRHANGVYLFVGDPVPFGYEGEKHEFYGHHPVTVSLILGDRGGDEDLYCYLDGPHWHVFPPPPDHEFVEKEEVHYFAGDYPQAYHAGKSRYASVNVVYKPLKYARPVVVSPPPPEYHGPVISVDVQLPSVGIQIGNPRPVIIVNDPPRYEGKHKKFKHKKFKGRD